MNANLPVTSQILLTRNQQESSLRLVAATLLKNTHIFNHVNSSGAGSADPGPQAPDPPVFVDSAGRANLE